MVSNPAERTGHGNVHNEVCRVYTVGSENHSGLLKLTADCSLGVENVRITADLEKSYFCTSCF